MFNVSEGQFRRTVSRKYPPSWWDKFQTGAIPFTNDPRTPTHVPGTVASYNQFVDNVLRLTGAAARNNADLEGFLASTCYLLGWFLGDLGKHYRTESRKVIDVDLQLTQNHPENLALGEYVGGCIRLLGIGCKRMPDRPPRRGLPKGAFCWASQRHQIFTWFHLSCLGLKWHERTSYDRANMNWMYSAPRESRVWFLRGLADSDGDVHFRDKSVDITTSPNTSLVKTLLISLGIHSVVRFTRGYGVVTIRASEAAKVGIFNPEVQSYRRKLLERLVGAKVYPRHWPTWLERKVTRLILSGLSKREICERVLFEDNTYIKMQSLKRKMQGLTRPVYTKSPRRFEYF